MTEQKKKDTKEGRAGRRKVNTSTINKPDDDSNGDPKKGSRTSRTITTANKETLKNKREPCKMLCMNARGLMNENTR